MVFFGKASYNKGQMIVWEMYYTISQICCIIYWLCWTIKRKKIDHN